MSNQERSHSIQDQKQTDRSPRVVGNYVIGLQQPSLPDLTLAL